MSPWVSIHLETALMFDVSLTKTTPRAPYYSERDGHKDRSIDWFIHVSMCYFNMVRPGSLMWWLALDGTDSNATAADPLPRRGEDGSVWPHQRCQYSVQCMALMCGEL